MAGDGGQHGLLGGGGHCEDRIDESGQLVERKACVAEACSRWGRRGRSHGLRCNARSLHGLVGGHSLLRTIESLTDFDIFCAIMNDVRWQGEMV